MLTTKSIEPKRSAVSRAAFAMSSRRWTLVLVVERLNVATLAPCFSARVAMSAPMP